MARVVFDSLNSLKNTPTEPGGGQMPVSFQAVTDASEQLHSVLVIFVSAVGEVESRDIHSRAEHGFKHVLL